MKWTLTHNDRILTLTEATGDKSARVQEQEDESESNVIDLKRLAGL